MTVTQDLTGVSTKIEALCISVINRCHNVNATDSIVALYAPILSAFNSFSHKRITETLPYLKKLSQKIKENHDCMTCSGACAMQHDMSLVHIVTSHHQLEEKLKELAELLRKSNLQKQVSDMLSALNRSVMELIHLEKEQLIPLIRDAKTRINAH